MRKLSVAFVHDLKNGLLHPILERVQQDHTLMLAIRDGYINIYYRGGNIFKLTEQGDATYKPYFDDKYNEAGKAFSLSLEPIKSHDEVSAWVDTFPHLKEMMDLYFSKHSKPEREYQQLVARENNYSTISNESEYFISDIEFADSGLGARFDMLAIRWLATDRKDGSNCRPVLIEMKYGDGALGGSCGLLDHLKDIDQLISDDATYKGLLEMMETQFNQLVELGLLKFNRGSHGAKIKLSGNPEVIFLLANHNPRSTKLSSILADENVVPYDQNPHFDLRFFVSNFAGYGLHSDCMQTLTQFRTLLRNLNNK